MNSSEDDYALLRSEQNVRLKGLNRQKHHAFLDVDYRKKIIKENGLQLGKNTGGSNNMDTLVIKTTTGEWQEIILPEGTNVIRQGANLEISHEENPILTMLGINRHYTNQGKIVKIKRGNAQVASSDHWIPTQKIIISGMNFFTIPPTITNHLK